MRVEIIHNVIVDVRPRFLFLAPIVFFFFFDGAFVLRFLFGVPEPAAFIIFIVVNAPEAETVRTIYRRYAELGSVRTLKEDLDTDGIVSKIRIDKYGHQTGGKPLARGALYLMLQNRIYRGEIVHKDKSYPGEQAAIIDEALWNKVQKRLADNRVDRQTGASASEPSLLAGLIYDDIGERMTPTHANKKGRGVMTIAP